MGWVAVSTWKVPPPAASAPAPLTPPELVGRQWLKPVGTEVDYVGDGACKPCHAREFESHSLTPHARTVRRLARDEKLAEFHSRVELVDEAAQAVYRLQPAGDANRLVAFRPDKTERVVPHWLFGSGTHAQTYVAEGPERYIELRLSYYPPVKKWNLTPGQARIDATQTALGQVYTPLGVASCFGCHSTVLVGTPEKLDFQRSLLNVGCESCHGGGRAHVESALKLAKGEKLAALLRPEAPRGEKVMELCGSCHRSLENFQDGDPRLESQLARFPGAALMRSRCYTQSNGQLDCSSCHNPHQRASTDPKSYDAACGKCHIRAEHTACTAGKTERCVSCHMPKQSIARKLPLAFHNHWIKVWDELSGSAARPAASP